MSSQWLMKEVHREVDRVLSAPPKVPLWVHWRRGSIVVSAWQKLDQGYERLGLQVPQEMTREELREWMMHELKRVPCHP